MAKNDNVLLGEWIDTIWLAITIAQALNNCCIKPTLEEMQSLWMDVTDDLEDYIMRKATDMAMRRIKDETTKPD